MLGLMAAFLIPIGMSSLRGLTHVLSCETKEKTPFAIQIPPPELGPPSITSSNRITRGDALGACAKPGEAGLFLEMGAKVLAQDKIAMIVGITNRSKLDWKGTVEVHLDDTAIPVGIGEIKAGDTEEDSVEFELDEGTHEINGSLLIGP